MTSLTSTVLTSAVIATIVSGLVTLLVSERRIAAENVIQERTKWRDKIRCLALEVHEAFAKNDAAKLKELLARLSLHLSPHDSEDQQILALIASGDQNRAEEFTQRLALLLKHDWERAKYEASLWRWMCQKPPVRVGFQDYTPGRERNYRIRRFFVGELVLPREAEDDA
jgi:hypothetical protein